MPITLPNWISVTTDNGGPRWVNLSRAIEIQPGYTGPKQFSGFIIHFGQDEHDIHVGKKEEVIQLAAMLGFKLPGAK